MDPLTGEVEESMDVDVLNGAGPDDDVGTEAEDPEHQFMKGVAYIYRNVLNNIIIIYVKKNIWSLYYFYT